MIILVGNGEQPTPIGELIDGFDEVWRLNECSLSDVVGHKTTGIICHNALEGAVRKRHPDTQVLVADIPSIIHNRIQEGQLNNIDGGFWHTANIWAEGHEGTPTTGMVALCFLVLAKGPLAITGFDHGESAHYDNPKHTHTAGHAWQGQKDMIELFIRNGLVSLV